METKDYNISTLNNINRTFSLKGSYFKDKFIEKHFEELQTMTESISEVKYLLKKFEEEYIEPEHDDSDERNDEARLERELI